MKVATDRYRNLIKETVKRGLVSLKKDQAADGNFTCFSTTSSRSFKDCIHYNSIFSTALILLCLSELKEEYDFKKMSSKAVNFLISQKSNYWTFNYWKRKSGETKKMPFPDDLDDTFCALAAIHKYKPALIDGAVMGSVVDILTAVEKQEGGPYRTWLVPDTADKIWLDIDLAVNANVAYFLKLQDIQLPNIDSFIEAHIKESNYSSPYYLGPLPVIYFISRYYELSLPRSNRGSLEFLSEDNKKKIRKNPLETALAISALLNLNVNPQEVEEDIRYLLSTHKNGSWKPYSLVVETLKGKGKIYSGSSALTTAFCIEALDKYIAVLKEEEPSSLKQYAFDKQSNFIQKAVLEDIELKLKTADPQLKEKILYNIKTMVGNSANAHIFLLPNIFKEALGEKGEMVPEDILKQLAVANLLGWFSYGIYDNFLDEEGHPWMLPLGNFASREFTLLASNLFPQERGFINFFKTIMNKIDAANLWEVSYCRLKVEDDRVTINRKDLPKWRSYRKLAERSLGHTLTPVAILYYLGFDKSSKEIALIVKFFTHYLIAKQLNDDAHDFEDDLRAGILTPLVSTLINKYSHQKKEALVSFEISKVVPDFQNIFWREVIDDVSKDILANVNSAREILKKMTYLQKPILLENLLLPLEQSGYKALKEKEEMIKFMNELSQARVLI